MGGNLPGTREPRLRDLHATLIELGWNDKLIPVDRWLSLLAQGLQISTRQAAHDATWYMEQLGLIRRIKGKGVVPLSVQGLVERLPDNSRVGVPVDS